MKLKIIYNNGTVYVYKGFTREELSAIAIRSRSNPEIRTYELWNV